MMTCPMIKRRLRTAQKTPAGWLGTVEFLQKSRQQGHTRTTGGDVRDIIVTHCRRVLRGERVLDTWIVLVGVESLDVPDQGHDTARKDENEGDDAQGTDDIQSNEHVCNGSVSNQVSNQV